MVSDPASSVGVVAPLVSADELAVVSAVEVSAASVPLGAASVVGLSAIVVSAPAAPSSIPRTWDVINRLTES